MTIPGRRTLKGESFQYHVGDYHIRLSFVDDNHVRWQYLAAPDGMSGKTGLESIDTVVIRDDISIIAWKEADGTQVLDVLDLGGMMMYANFVTAAGERVSVQAPVEFAT